MPNPTAFFERKTIQKLSLAALVLFVSLLFVSSAQAELYCDSQIKARSEQNRQNAITRDIARFEGTYGQANSFDSLYCGAQITSGFDRIGQNLVGSLTNQVNNLINQLFQQACKAAIAPIQNLAAQTCIPNFANLYLNPNLLNFNLNRNYCPGTQLIQVTPVTGGSSFQGGGNYSTPQLWW